jgi:hypothetical protein
MDVLMEIYVLIFLILCTFVFRTHRITYRTFGIAAHWPNGCSASALLFFELKQYQANV